MKDKTTENTNVCACTSHCSSGIVSLPLTSTTVTWCRYTSAGEGRYDGIVSLVVTCDRCKYHPLQHSCVASPACKHDVYCSRIQMSASNLPLLVQPSIRPITQARAVWTSVLPQCLLTITLQFPYGSPQVCTVLTNPDADRQLLQTVQNQWSSPVQVLKHVDVSYSWSF